MKTGKGKIGVLSVIAILIPLLFKGCLDPDSLVKAERKQIDLYLETLGDTVVLLKPSGLYYIELTPGTGVSPVDKDTVTIKGRGLYLDYVQFTSNLISSTPDKFVVGSGDKIAGIDEGVKYMKTGGKARLLTPSALAYGFTPLLWEITLISVKPGPGK